MPRFLLIEVDNTVRPPRPHVVAEFTDEGAALKAHQGLDDVRVANGVPMTERYFAVREAEDDISPLIELLRDATIVTPQPAKPKRHQSRTVEGVKLINQGDRQWTSEDGEYTIEYVDNYETECDDEHPVRISQRMRAEFAAEPAWRQEAFYPSEMAWAIRTGEKGYLCPGQQVHTYGLWEVGSRRVELIAREESFKNALAALGAFLRTGETSV